MSIFPTPNPIVYVPWENRVLVIGEDLRIFVVPAEKLRISSVPEEVRIFVVPPEDRSDGLSLLMPLDGLILRYAFDEGSGNVVHDTSGLAHDMAPASGSLIWTVAGLSDAVAAQTVNNALWDHLTAASGLTVIMCATGKWHDVGAFSEYTIQGAYGRGIRNTRSGAWPPIGEMFAAAFFSAYMGTNTWKDHGLTGIGWHTIGQVFRALGQGSDRYYIDGTPLGDATDRSYLLLDWGGPIIVGGEDLGNEMGYLLVYNRQLTDAEIQQATNYMRWAMAGRGVILP